jgi:hypothetical protein
MLTPITHLAGKAVNTHADETIDVEDVHGRKSYVLILPQRRRSKARYLPHRPKTHELGDDHLVR